MSEREAVTPEMIAGFTEAFHVIPANSVPYDEALKAGLEGALAARTATAGQADGTTSDKYRAELYDEVWQKARDMGYGNVTDALAEVERLREERDSYQRVGIKAMEERDALKADAERYRWLRRKNRNNIVVRNGVSHLFDELLDRSIDAARTAKPEVDHE